MQARTLAGVSRYAGNADVPVRSQRKSHSYADDDVRVPGISPVDLKNVPLPTCAPVKVVRFIQTNPTQFRICLLIFDRRLDSMRPRLPPGGRIGYVG